MMGKKHRFWFSRTFLIIVGSIFVLLAFAYGWGLQTLMSLKLRQEAKHLPVLALTPQALPAVTPNPAEGTRLSDDGFVFEVPWDDLDSQKTRYVGTIAIFVFRSGRVVEFFPPGPTSGDLLATAEKSLGNQNGSFRQLLGPDTVKSNYSFHKTMLESTPSNVRPWMSAREVIRASFLLMIKGISSVGGETGIFQVKAGDWKGFQFDDPAKSIRKVTLELYDSGDRHAEIIFIPSAKTSDAGITQADVNRVLETLRPTDQLSTRGNVPRGNAN